MHPYATDDSLTKDHLLREALFRCGTIYRPICAVRGPNNVASTEEYWLGKEKYNAKYMGQMGAPAGGFSNAPPPSGTYAPPPSNGRFN